MKVWRFSFSLTVLFSLNLQDYVDLCCIVKSHLTVRVRSVALWLSNVRGAISFWLGYQCFGNETAFAEMLAVKIWNGAPGSISVISVGQSTIVTKWYRVEAIKSQKSFCQTSGATVSHMNRSIFFWRDTRQSWSSSSCSTQLQSFNFAIRLDYTFRREVSENYEVTVHKNESIGTRREGHGTTLHSLMTMRRMHQSMKDVPKGTSYGEILDFQRSPYTKHTISYKHLCDTSDVYFLLCICLKEERVGALDLTVQNSRKNDIAFNFMAEPASSVLETVRTLFSQLPMQSQSLLMRQFNNNVLFGAFLHLKCWQCKEHETADSGCWWLECSKQHYLYLHYWKRLRFWNL